jgi:hypothetical protein
VFLFSSFSRGRTKQESRVVTHEDGPVCWIESLDDLRSVNQLRTQGDGRHMHLDVGVVEMIGKREMWGQADTICIQGQQKVTLMLFL